MQYLTSDLYTTEEYQTLCAFFIEFFKTNNRTAKNYAHDYNIFRKFMKENYPSKNMFMFEAVEIEDFFYRIAAAYDRPLAISTRERVYDQLHRLYEYFRVRKLINNNPLHQIKKEISDKKINSDKLLSWQEADRLMEAVNKMDLREQVMIYLIYTAALKVKELIALNWNDIGFDGKGKPGITVRKGRIVIYKKLHPDVFQLLVDYKASSNRGSSITPTDADPVFINSNGSRISESWVRKSVYAACELAGIGQYSPSDLRNSTAAFLKGRGVSDKYISELMGYSDAFLTNRIPTILPDTIDMLHFNLKGK